MMDKLLKTISDLGHWKLVVCALIFIGFFSPIYLLMIIRYGLDYIRTVDIIHLILVSFSISTPLYFINGLLLSLFGGAKNKNGSTKKHLFVWLMVWTSISSYSTVIYYHFFSKTELLTLIMVFAVFDVIWLLILLPIIRLLSNQCL
jgi:hypothetical protein